MANHPEEPEAASTDAEPADPDGTSDGGRPEGGQPDDGQPSDGQPDDGRDDDTRRRYREILERKQQKSASQSGSGTDAGGKSLAATSSGKRQRVFRRKSGG